MCPVYFVNYVTGLYPTPALSQWERGPAYADRCPSRWSIAPGTDHAPHLVPQGRPGGGLVWFFNACTRRTPGTTPLAFRLLYRRIVCSIHAIYVSEAFMFALIAFA